MKKTVKIEKMSWASVKFARVLACVLTAGFVGMSAFAQEATGVAFNYKMATAKPGQTMVLKYSTVPTGAIDGLTWSSSDESVATVDQDGVVTVPTTAQGGQATITVTCANGASASLEFDAATPLPQTNVSTPIDVSYLDGNAVAGATEDFSVFSSGFLDGYQGFFADAREVKRSYTYNNTTYTGVFGLTNCMYVADVNTGDDIPFLFDGYQNDATAFDGNDCIRLYKGHTEKIVDVVVTNYYSKWYVLATAGGPGDGNYANVDVIVHYSDGTTDERAFKVHDWVQNTNDAYSVSTVPQYRLSTLYTCTGTNAKDGSEIDQNTWGAQNATVPFQGHYLHALSIDTNPSKFVTELEMKLTGKNDGTDLTDLYACFFASAGRTGGYLQMPRTALSNANSTSKSVLASTLVGDWAAVEGATGYYYELSTTPNFAEGTVVSSATVEKDVNTATFTGLDPNTTYYFRARATFEDEDGVTRNSNVSSATTADYEVVEKDADEIDKLTDLERINYALGVDASDVASKLILNIWDSNEFDVNGEAKTLVQAIAPGVEALRPTNVTTKIEYTLSKTTVDLTNEFVTVATQEDANFVCDANDADQTFWKGHMKVTVTLKSDTTKTWTAECDSANIVGLTRVASTNEMTPVAVAYDTPAWDVKNTTASNVVGLANLQVGDELWTWDFTVGAYRIFLVAADANNNLYWDSTPLTIYRDGTNTSEIAAADYEMNRGFGFWLKRATPTDRVHVFGQVPYTDAPDAVVTLTAGANTLIGAQHYKQLEFKKGQALPEAYAKIFANRGGDVIQVKQADGSTYEYEYRTKIGGWSRYYREGSKLKTQKTFSIPLGQAFYYSNNGDADIELNWSAK